MGKIFYETAVQRKRNHEIMKAYTEAVMSRFGTDNYCTTADNLNVRMFERLNQCIPFFDSGIETADIEANRLIRKEKMEFCQFTPMLCIETLIGYGDKLDADNFYKYERYLKEILDQFLEKDLDFVGVNDNFPCIATYITLIGGQLFKREDAYLTGVRRLRQLADMFRRRGSQSEYNSPSYIAGQISAIALTAERVEDTQLKELALQCEERLWIDFLGRLMPFLCCSAGPRSRSYISAYLGGVNSIKLIYLLLGEKAPVKPVLPFYSDLLLSPLHCPVELAEWFLNRTYPYEFQATFEFNSSNDGLPNGRRRGHHDGKPDPGTRNPYLEEELYEYPSGVGSTFTYMEDCYAVGTATREFHNGQQTDSFLISYSKTSEPKNDRDAGWVFTRYIINDKLPGQPNLYPEYGVQDSGFNTWDMGRKTCFQYKNSAMVLYKPKSFACKGVYSMRLCIVFPAHVNQPVKKIFIGDQEVLNYNGHSGKKESVYIFDGDIFMVFHPLLLTDYGREDAVKVEMVNDMIIVSFYNYQGPETDFCARGFLLTGNGFVCEVRKAEEYESFEDFRREMGRYILEDTIQTNPHVRQTFQRITKYRTESVSLECEYSPVSEGIRYQMANGRLLEECKLRADGLDISTLPFI